MQTAQSGPQSTRWVHYEGSTAAVGEGAAVSPHIDDLNRVFSGDRLGDPSTLFFRDPHSFRAGELHQHYDEWAMMVGEHPNPQQVQVLKWIREQVSIFPHFRRFAGTFKGQTYDSPRPPTRLFQNNRSCKPFTEFVRRTLLDRLRTGAISLIGRLGCVPLPHLVLPLTIEPNKPRLCHDARFLNLWIVDHPFKLDRLSDVPRYVPRDSYQTILDDKSGYDHILLTSRTFFGIQWGGWLFTYNTLPFGWKASPFVYHTTGLVSPISFAPDESHVHCILMIDMSDSCRFPYHVEPMLP